jgi:membrane-associated phospholipid phosphatase
VHEHDIVRAERWLFGGTEPTIFLQHHLYDPHQVYWYDAFFTLVYTTHFAATPVLAAILWLRNRATWLRFVSRIVVLSVAGLITYIAFPEAPPWLAAQDGLTAPVARSSARGWIWLHAGNVNHLLAKAQSDGSNPVAAMPSMHFAVATTVAIAIAWHLPRRFRWLMVLYPLAMGFALVYLGEHWVIDIVVGLIYAIVVHFVMNRVEKWVAMRRERTDQLQPGDPAVDVIPV